MSLKNLKIKKSPCSPPRPGPQGHYRELFEDIRKQGYLKVRVDGEVKDLAAKMQVDRYKIHDIEVVIDRLAVTDDMKPRLGQKRSESIADGEEPHVPPGQRRQPPAPVQQTTDVRRHRYQL